MSVAGTPTIASLAVSVTANTSQAEAALTGLAARMGSSSLLALAPVVIGAAIAGVGIAAIHMAGDFQAGILTLRTGAGELKGNMQLVHDSILQMAVDTGTSTQQLIAGMFMIESAGYHGAQGLAVLQAAAEGAKVGNADLGTVADAVTTVMKDYKDANVTAAQATNLLIATVASGKTHMEDLAASISTVLPVASKFHVSLGDVMGAMATMTGNGVAAANAATYLRQMIVSLEAPTSAGAKALASVGLSAQDVVNSIRTSGLPATLQMITDDIGKHFPAGSSAALTAFKEIAGGSRQMQGMLDLTGTSLKDFIANAQKLGGAATSTSSTITGWNLVQDTFNYKLSVAKETVMTLMISLGEHLLPVATQFVTWITGSAIPAITNLIHFITGTSQQAEILRPIILFVAIAIGGALVAAFVAWAAAAIAAAVATTLASWWILAIGAAIALLVVGIIWAYKNWGWFRDIVQAVATVVGDIVGFIASHAIPVFEGFIAPIVALIQFFGQLIAIIGKAIGIIGNIAGAVGNAAGAVKNFVGGALSHIPGFAVGGTMPDTGLAVVGEQGPEIVALPGGSRISPLSSAGGGISGLPAGMSSVPAAASGAMNGQPIQVNLYLDRNKLGMAMAQAVPGAVRNATGARSF